MKHVRKTINRQQFWLNCTMSSGTSLLERIHSVLVNLVRTYNVQVAYLEQYDPWINIVTDAEFEIFSTGNMLKGYTLGNLIFVCDMTLLIKYNLYW